MRKTLSLLAGAALFACAPAAFAQPSPNEERGMHIGDAHTNGSSTIVNDRNGIHPEGYEGQAPINQLAADNHTLRPAYRHHRHHRRHPATSY